MTTDKRIVNDWKTEDEAKLISQVNDFEIEMTNKGCTDWMKEITNQHEMSNASITLMDEAQYEVRKGDAKFMVKEITKYSDVIEASRREKGQRVLT